VNSNKCIPRHYLKFSSHESSYSIHNNIHFHQHQNVIVFINNMNHDNKIILKFKFETNL
jgi:hypothetical protein